MTEFLMGAAFVAVISTIASLFLLYHARKEEKDFKTRVGKK